MGRTVVFLLSLLCLLPLAGCNEEAPRTDIQVCIQPPEEVTVENNGIFISPGEDAVFYLEMASGCSVSGVDYPGGYRTARRGGKVELTLEQVRFPTRVTLEVTRRYASVTYLPNGGTGEESTVTYDLTNHARPNTDTGVDLFFREGYTLTGWNTAADGSGERVGLGSRITPAPGGVTLYAQWERWTEEASFAWTVVEDGAVITGYRGADEHLIVPAQIGGQAVVGITAGAFEDCAAGRVVFPNTLRWVEDGAFRRCRASTLVLFDNIERIGDDAFTDCALRTLFINAVEAPYGYGYRKESCYADKVDLLILTQGERRLIGYGGCAMWYNLDGAMMAAAFPTYTFVNLGLNGTVNSAVQMQIMGAFLGEGDVLFHTPELSSKYQLLGATEMGDNDVRLWCGLENNYDLFALVDLGNVSGVLDSLCHYLSVKDGRSSYYAVYQDGNRRTYLDRFGCASFYRGVSQEKLSDSVYLDPAYLTEAGMERLEAYYDWYASLGVAVFVSYPCVNLDAVPEGQRGNAALMDERFRKFIGGMDSAALVSSLEDYLYENADFYDTNYHLLTDPTIQNTAKWIFDLQPYLGEEAT